MEGTIVSFLRHAEVQRLSQSIRSVDPNGKIPHRSVRDAQRQ